MEKPDRVFELINSKKALMECFLALTVEQKECVEAREYEKLLTLIAQKQTIIEKINSLEQELEEVELSNLEQVEAIRGQLNEIIQKIFEIDENNLQLLKVNKEDIGAVLKNMYKSKETHFLYRGKHIGIEGILVDKKK
ncbi:MAG: flagellar export chaperone FlgN [Bacillota bacterium]